MNYSKIKFNLLKNAISKAYEEVVEMEPDFVAVPRLLHKRSPKHCRLSSSRRPQSETFNTNVPESRDSINGRIDNDFTEVVGILNNIGLKADAINVSFRRLGKSMSQSGEHRKCRPLLNTC